MLAFTLPDVAAQLWPYALALIGVAVVVALIALALRGAAPSDRSPTDKPGLDTAEYVARPILTEAEARFFHALREALADEGVVFAQVPVAALVKTIGNAPGRCAARNKIDRKTVDFVAVDPKTLAPLAAIELDDRSHERPSRQERDRFVEGVLNGAGYRLVRVRVQRTGYDTADLRLRILGTDSAHHSGPPV